MNKKKRKVVLVAATMSAGKSSIINALVGQELLHSANEATTAKVTRIHMGKFSKSKVSAYKHDGKLFESRNELCTDLLQKWNRDELIAEVDVNYSMTNNKSNRILKGLTIIDTPGANNSVDESHNKAFVQALKEYPKSTLLYILNATQLGTTDDVEILKIIRKYHSTKNVIFALNKVDLLDEELGEDIKKYVDNAKNYLESLGFRKPKIIPTMALTALAGEKKLSNEVLARTERHALISELERFNENPQLLSQAALLPYRVKRNWTRRMRTQERKNTIEIGRNELHKFSDYCGFQVLKTLVKGKS